MEDLLKHVAEVVALALETISVLLVAIGGLEATWKTLWPLLSGSNSHGSRRNAWLSLARWLLLALEFMLAADIVRSTIAPNWNDIGQLASIAVIRTFLNFFLERDLETAVAKAEEPR